MGRSISNLKKNRLKLNWTPPHWTPELWLQVQYWLLWRPKIRTSLGIFSMNWLSFSTALVFELVDLALGKFIFPFMEAV